MGHAQKLSIACSTVANQTTAHMFVYHQLAQAAVILLVVALHMSCMQSLYNTLLLQDKRWMTTSEMPSKGYETTCTAPKAVLLSA